PGAQGSPRAAPGRPAAGRKTHRPAGAPGAHGRANRGFRDLGDVFPQPGAERGDGARRSRRRRTGNPLDGRRARAPRAGPGGNASVLPAQPSKQGGLGTPVTSLNRFLSTPREDFALMDPKTLKFATTHEWVHLDGDIATVGISQFAVDQ